MTPAVSQAGWKSAPASADAECLQACSLRDAALRRSMRLVQERNRRVPSPKRSRIPSNAADDDCKLIVQIMGLGCGQIGVIDSHDSSHASRLHAAPLRDFPSFSSFTNLTGAQPSSQLSPECAHRAAVVAPELPRAARPRHQHSYTARIAFRVTLSVFHRASKDDCPHRDTCAYLHPEDRCTQ